MSRSGVFGCLWSAALSALAMLMVQVPRGPAPETAPLVFNLQRRGPLEVTVDRALEIPGNWRDFDLIGEVELSAGCELDIVFRRVEPQVGAARFHGRFHLLRLSASLEGPPYRTREQALFGDLRGGLRLGPGVPATVRLAARGRRVEGNVAGRRLPPVTTVDDHGHLLLAVRDGKALLRKLEIHPVVPGDLVPGWLLASILGFAVGALAVGMGAMERYAWTVLVVPLGALASARVVVAQMLPMTVPGEGTQLLLSMWCLPMGLALAVRPLRLRYVLAAALTGLLAVEAGSRRAVAQLLPFEDPRLSLYFGERSGAAPLDALVRRVHSTTSTDTMTPAERRVFFMGGKLLYEPMTREELFSPDLDDRQMLGSMTTGLLRERLGTDVVGTVIPTYEANAWQQLLLLRTFYLDLAPRAVVFAVTQAESRPVAGGNVRRRLQLVDAPEPGPGFVLGSLLRGPVREPAGTPDDLRQTLDELALLCRERDIALVLLMESDLQPQLREVVRRTATARGVPLCTLDPRADGKSRARSLADVLLPVLQ